jgi:hypothetical protein
MAKATVDGLKNLRRPADVAKARGLTINQVLPLPRVGTEREVAQREAAAEAAAAPAPAVEETTVAEA